MSNSRVNIWLILSVLLLIALIALGVLYTQSTSATTTANATSTALSQAFADFRSEAESAAATATQAADDSAAALGSLAADATQAADDSAAALDSLAADATQAADDSAAALDSLAADATQAADDSAAALDSLAADATQAADDSAAALDSLAADATQAADDSATALDSLAADATQAADDSAAALDSLAATATQAANDSATALDSLAADATQAAQSALDSQATLTEVVATATQFSVDSNAALNSLAARATVAAVEFRATLGAPVTEPNPNLLPTVTPRVESTEAAPVPTAGARFLPDAATLATLANVEVEQLTLTDQRKGELIDLSGLQDELVVETFDGRYDDFVLSAIIGWGDGAQDDYCGFTFYGEEDEGGYYTAEIDRLGAARFYGFIDNEWEYLDGLVTPNVATEPEALNVLVLVGQNRTFTLYVNGEQTVSITDERVPSGVLTLLGGTFTGVDTGGCNFLEAHAWSIASESTASNFYEGIPTERTTDGAFILGDPLAPVTLVQFADFACPHCQNYLPTMHAFVDEHVRSGNARLEFRMFPTADRNAVALRLAECAANDDPARFWQVHDSIYELLIGGTRLDNLAEALAETVGQPVSALNACTETASQYLTDQQLGVISGVTGTPALRIRTVQGDLIPIAPEFANGGVPLEVLAEVVSSFFQNRS